MTMGRGQARVACWLFLFLFAVFAFGAQGGIFNPDAEVEFQTARSLYLRGSAGLSDAHPDASSAERFIVNFVPEEGRRGFDCMQGRDGAFYSWFGIGHALVLVPFYATGRALAALFPEVEAAGLQRAVQDAENLGANPGYARAFNEDFFSHLVVSFHTPLFAAGLGVVIFFVLAHLGVSLLARLLAVLAACFTTQVWPGSREAMSDITAGFFLVFALERVLAWKVRCAAHVNGQARLTLVVAGLACAATIAVRNAQVVPVFVIVAYAFLLSFTRGGDSASLSKRVMADALAILVPIAAVVVALLVFNYARFGSPFETGYSAGTAKGFWNFPMHLGMAFLLASPGKGALVFCPLLVVVPLVFLRLANGRRLDLLLVSAMLVLPWLLVSRTTGWHSSQAWASRYMTVGSVLCIAVAVGLAIDALPRRALARRVLPWLAALGFVINLGGVLTSYRGYYDLGRPAFATWFQDVDPREDQFQRVVLVPRLSPALGHWLYAFENALGRVPATDPQTAERSWRTIYGVVPRDGASVPLPQKLEFVEDRSFRHLWPVGLSLRFASSVPAVCGLVLLLLAALAAWRLRRSCSSGLEPPGAD